VRLPATTVVAFALLTLAAFMEPGAERANAGTTSHRVVALLVALPGRRPLAATPTQVVQSLFGATDSVAAHFNSLSRGAVDVSGTLADVRGPFVVAEPADICGRGLGLLADAADSAARAAGADLSPYDRFVYVIPPDVPCSSMGLGLIGGRRVWAKAATTRLLQHELGHTLGLDHARLWSDASADASDFMGSADLGLNAAHLVQLGWLSAPEVVHVTSDQTFVLVPLEASASSPSPTRVAIVEAALGANTYTLSYRAASVVNPLAEAYTRGVNLHVVDTSRGSPKTYFVGALADGEVFRDGPLRVRQLSHVPGGQVRLQVDFSGGGTARPAGPPPAPSETFQSVATTKCIDVEHGSVTAGASVIQYDCHEGPNQKWTVEPSGDGLSRVVNVRSGRCLAVREPAESEAPIVQADCDGESHLWSVLRNGQGQLSLMDSASGLCLDVPHAARGDVQLAVWRCTGGTNQLWRRTSSP
jgi:hypothetical protein